MDLLGWLLVGLLAGWLSAMVVPGRTARGCLANTVVGILGGVVGGYLAREAHVGDPRGFIGAVVVAFIGAVLVRLIIGAVSSSDLR
ncbi:MAG: GlsB/YeaQ/YmgE family stress response membrane protein [Chloroflexota bacterium]|nr:GlsB/YeaQ/YmgE family stress response membrane protein [Chloroflexota bacterium]